jgi:hypothetical protein
VAWLEDFDTKLKCRAVELERKEADLAHRMELAEQLERDFAERERHIAENRAQADEFARRLADQEHALRTREQQDRGEVRGLREQYEAMLRELEDRDAALKRMETELINRRRAVEVCESAIARFQLTFERVLETRTDAQASPHAAQAPAAGRTADARGAGELRSASLDGLGFSAPLEFGSKAAPRGLAPQAVESAAPMAVSIGAESWGEWQGPTR